VASHPGGVSFFITRDGSGPLANTYGYRPFCTDEYGAREAACRMELLFAKSASWITGRRLVSLPFADHCEPLLSES